jgi:hypothetical protein
MSQIARALCKAERCWWELEGLGGVIKSIWGNDSEWNLVRRTRYSVAPGSKNRKSVIDRLIYLIRETTPCIPKGYAA